MSLYNQVGTTHTPEEIRRRDDARFRSHALEPLPLAAARTLQRQTDQVERSRGYREANLFVATRSAALIKAKCWIAFDEAEIEARAHAAAQLARITRDAGKLQDFCESQGIEYPHAPGMTAEGIRERLQEARWWRRRLRNLYARAAEHGLRAAVMINKYAAPYVSADGLARFQQQQRNARAWLESREIVELETGDVLPLATVADSSLSKPEIRCAEFMTRVHGFEECAKQRRDVALFVTLTAPSRFHAVRIDGTPNPKFSVNESARDTQAWLCRMWARARARLHRKGITYYGFRVAEPHHDATPHWHLLLFVSPYALEALSVVLREVWLSEDGNEPGALERRACFVEIDPARGSATGYIAKYIAKNTAGVALATDDEKETDLSGAAAQQLVVAWARIHGVRQFQQLGGPRVGVWREARRLKGPMIGRLQWLADIVSKPADWAAYVEFMGGIEHCRTFAPVLLHKALRRDKNRYGEPAPPQAVGLLVRNGPAWVVHHTRLGHWRIIGKIAALASLPFYTWTCGNNCTAPIDMGDPDYWTSRETGTGPPPETWAVICKIDPILGF